MADNSPIFITTKGDQSAPIVIAARQDQGATGQAHTGTQAPGQGAEHKGGLPQLNTQDFAPQLVWLAISFGVLYWIMSRIALPRIADVIEKRRDRIATDIDSARRFQQETEQAEIAYKTALAEAKSKAHAIAQEQRDALSAATEAKKAEVEATIATKLQEAEQRISASKQAAMKEVNSIAESTTREIVDKLVGAKISDDELAEALRSASAK